MITVPKTNEKVFALALQRDGKLIIGGDSTVNGTTRATEFARLNSDADSGHHLQLNVYTSGGEVKSLVLQTDEDHHRGRFDTRWAAWRAAILCG